MSPFKLQANLLCLCVTWTPVPFPFKKPFASIQQCLDNNEINLINGGQFYGPDLLNLKLWGSGSNTEKSILVLVISIKMLSTLLPWSQTAPSRQLIIL